MCGWGALASLGVEGERVLYQVVLVADREAQGTLQPVCSEDGAWEMPLRTARAVARRMERHGLFAVVVDENGERV